MRLIKVAVACVNQTPFAWESNFGHLRMAIEHARAEGATMLCLPELAITGYACEDAFFMDGLQDVAFAQLDALAPLTRGMVVAVGIPIYHEKALYNAAALLADTKIVGFVAKQFLAADGIHYEPRWFKPWPAGEIDALERTAEDGSIRRFPIGDLVFDIGDVRVGFEICEDAWVANRPGTDLALRGVDIMCNPSASHFAFGKFHVRQRFVIEGSRAFGVAYLYANLLGNEAGRVIYDGGGLIASGGELLVRGRRFSFHDVELAAAIVDIDGNRREQARRGSHRPRHDAERQVIEHPFLWPVRKPEAPPAPTRSWEDRTSLREEEFARAVALGLWDYLRKSHAQGYVVSLSGGADSAACAVLVALAVQLAFQELGTGGVRQHLPWCRRLLDVLDKGGGATASVGALLSVAYQPTENSGKVTRLAAETVAKAVGAEFHVIDVDAQYKAYIQTLEKAIGRSLSWDKDDITLQNIQARVRAPSIRMLANLRGAVLITTSNRSEAAVGYATMDGDTAGGLAPLGGIDKSFLRQWLRWLEHKGLVGLEPIPALGVIKLQEPTAELRPPSSSQTDEADLMPYDFLEAVEDSAIRDKHTPTEVLQDLLPRYPDYAPGQLAIWVERFFRLWCQNQWKRERIAPSFHLDDRNVDPRSWCRFPILSGGFERELAEMRAFVAMGKLSDELLYEYPRPALAVDCVVFGLDENDLKVLRIERKLQPFQHSWALPGGFVHVDETLDDAARRELEEEAGVTDVYLEQLYTFGALDRDPRDRVVTVAYYALAKLSDHRIRAATDAMGVGWFGLDDLPKLAFDHVNIVASAHERLRGKVRYAPVGFELLPPRFSLTQLQRLYEIILGTDLDKRNFRKKILSMDLLVETDEVEQGVRHRAARLFRFDRRKYDRLAKQGFEFAM